jgi:predicted DNA-binding transcriptional regulator AlpA
MSDTTAPALEPFLDQPGIARALGIDRRTLGRLRADPRKGFPPPDLRLSATCIRWRVSTIESWLVEQGSVTR